MAHWLVPCNVCETFDLFYFLRNTDHVYWKQGSHAYEIDDIAYIYLSRRHKFVKYKFRITQVNCRYEDFDYSASIMSEYVKCWRNHEEFDIVRNLNRFIKLEYISMVEDNVIQYSSLVEHGVRNKMRTSVNMNENLTNFISHYFNELY